MNPRETGLHARHPSGRLLGAILLGLLAPLSAHALSGAGQHFETFPDAIQVEASCGVFQNLAINGAVLSDTGCLFRFENTSWGDGAASSFDRDPDRHFADDGSLTSEARSVLTSHQPYGLYSIELELAPGSASLVSAPFGFEIEVEFDIDEVEVEFEIPLLDEARGLFFDSNATGIPDLFEDPRTGVLEFFISTLSPDPGINSIEEEDGIHGIEVEAEFAWLSDGEVATRFSSFKNRRLGVEGLVVPSHSLPEPTTATLLALGLAFLELRSRHVARPRQEASRRLGGSCSQ